MAQLDGFPNPFEREPVVIAKRGRYNGLKAFCRNRRHPDPRVVALNDYDVCDASRKHFQEQ